jgi:hypothetical protein
MKLKLPAIGTGACSIVLITRERLVRADFASGGSGQVKGLWQRLRPETDNPAELVDSALRLGRKRLGRVIVLSSDAWAQTLRMPADAARGLADEELARALGFEAEPLSGIAAFDSRVAFTALRSDAQHREFWLVQTPESQLAQIGDVVHAAGGMLVGFGHPAGAAQPRASQAGERWQRVELWPGAIVCLRGGDDPSPQVHVINAEPGQRTWQAKVEQWLEAEPGAGDVQWLLPDASVQAPATGNGTTVALAQEESLRQWLAAAAGQLFGSSPGVPLVRPAVRPMSKQKQRAITGALAAAALLGCGGHYFWTERAIADLNAQSLALRGEANNYTALKKQVADLASKRDKAQAEMDKLGQKVTACDETLAAHQLRWKKLLELLAQHRPEHLVVQKIDSVGEKLSITGQCLGPHPANALASGLGLRLRELGWDVQPARQEAGTALVGGEPWKFELVLHDSDPAAAAPSSSGQPAIPLQPVPRGPINKVASFRAPGTADDRMVEQRTAGPQGAEQR